MRLNEPPPALDFAMLALAHPVRRAIVERVMRQETRVTDLAEPFEMSLNAVSKHIRVLERAGLVTRRRVWREHLVSFNPGPLDEVSKWVERQRALWTERFDALERLLKSEMLNAAGAAQVARAEGEKR